MNSRLPVSIVLIAALLLGGCGPRTYKVDKGNPFAVLSIDLDVVTGMANTLIHLNSKDCSDIYDLSPVVRNGRGWSEIPAGKPVTITNLSDVRVGNMQMYQWDICHVKITFQPEAGETYLMNNPLRSENCTVELKDSKGNSVDYVTREALVPLTESDAACKPMPATQARR